MPEDNWDDISEACLLPNGTYTFQIGSVEVEKTQDEGYKMWVFPITVARGVYEDQKIIDRLVFSKKGLSRVKLLFARIGKPLKGNMKAKPEDIEGQYVQARVRTKIFEGNEYNFIPYAGYESVQDEDEEA